MVNKLAQLKPIKEELKKPVSTEYDDCITDILASGGKDVSPGVTRLPTYLSHRDIQQAYLCQAAKRKSASEVHNALAASVVEREKAYLELKQYLESKQPKQ